MFDHKHYVPIIRWKQGERIALRELFPEDKAGWIPAEASARSPADPTALSEFIDSASRSG